MKILAQYKVGDYAYVYYDGHICRGKVNKVCAKAFMDIDGGVSSNVKYDMLVIGPKEYQRYGSTYSNSHDVRVMERDVYPTVDALCDNIENLKGGYRYEGGDVVCETKADIGQSVYYLSKNGLEHGVVDRIMTESGEPDEYAIVPAGSDREKGYDSVIVKSEGVFLTKEEAVERLKSEAKDYERDYRAGGDYGYL